MNFDSRESTIEDKKRLHTQHRKASEAMLRLIVLRDADHPSMPNLDPSSHEGWLRSEVFRLQSETLQVDPMGEYAEPREVTLAETMTRPELIAMTQPGRPLTRERLLQIDPSLIDVVDTMTQEGVGWPDEDVVFHDVIPEDFDDYAFGSSLVKNRAHYNNFPAILSAVPSKPDSNEPIMDFMLRTRVYQYATKPYLIRAHALQPDFMDALQKQVTELDSISEWADALQRAVTEEHPDPEDQILLRASRMAYQLLINVMRRDDLAIQSRILTMSMQQDITDPVKELWT